VVTRVAVTGAAGRIGQGVVALLRSRGKDVVAVDCVRPPRENLARENLARDNSDESVAWLHVEMTDYDSVVKSFADCDGLVHLAAIARPGILPDAEVHANNVVSSYNALRAAIEVGIVRISQASSINAIGAAWSRWPRYDYLPLDERHPSYVEDPYSLSKLICEQQADALVRRYSEVGIASLRFHMVVADRAKAVENYRGAAVDVAVKNLWGYTTLAASAGACLLGLEGENPGHEAFQIVAPDQLGGSPSAELAGRYFPGVPLRENLSEGEGFFDCSKAGRLLSWRHDDW
jgi:nucleoside-diphosphate-sugar epimerase